MIPFSYFWLIWVIFTTVAFGDSPPSLKPRLQWICTPSSIVLTIITETPFDGIGHSVGYRSTCSVTGNGTTETTLIIPWGGRKRDDQCGVKFDRLTKTYWVEVDVHRHSSIISENYPVFNVSCGNHSMSYQPEIDYFVELYPSPQIDFGNESPKNNGKTFTLDAFMASIDDIIKYRKLFRMSNCFVESEGTKTAVEIIDSFGCSTDLKFATNVVYKDEWASVNLSSVNPYLKVLKLKCEISICEEIDNCRPICDRHWYDSIVKAAETVGKWMGLNESPNSPAIIDPFMQNSKSTILHISVPLKPDETPPQTDFFVEECKNLDFYLFSFEHCCTPERTVWLSVAFGAVAAFLLVSLFFNAYFCLQKLEALKKNRVISGSDSVSDEYWCYEDYKKAKNSKEDEEEPFQRKPSLMRKFSKRRYAKVEKDEEEEIYATIKSKSATQAWKLVPLALPHIYDKPNPKNLSLSQIFENPYITLPSFHPKVSNREERGGSSIEDNPAYFCLPLKDGI